MRFKDRYEQMTPEQRVALASKLKKSPAYLWQLANRWDDRRPSLQLLRQMADADRKLSIKDMVLEFTDAQEATA